MNSVVKKVAESKVKSDKNGRAYKTCTFSKLTKREVIVPGVGKILVDDQARETSVNLYEERYLDNKMDYGFNTPVNTATESYLLGDIVTRKVAPYAINSVDRTTGEVTERMVDTFTTVVFGDTSDAAAFEAIIRNTFKSRGHQVASDSAIVAEVASVNDDILA